MKIDKIKEKIYIEFSKNWNIQIESIHYVYYILELTNYKYGKCSKILKNQNFDLSPRQLRYFNRKLKFMILLSGSRPANYSQLLRKRT